MLVLSRLPGESIKIADNITIHIIENNSRKVRVGIEAPPEVVILRKELWDREQAELALAQKETPPVVHTEGVPKRRAG